MSENLFPSGPWTGFNNYAPGDRHRMDLHLDFATGCVSGDGNDDVGRFLIGHGGFHIWPNGDQQRPADQSSPERGEDEENVVILAAEYGT